MKTIELNIYEFSELSDKVKQKVLDRFRYQSERFWCDESMESIDAFCKRFNVELKEWRIDSCDYSFSHNAKNENFRGLKLRQFDRDYMPTGYCLDCDLWMTFYDEFKRTGSALKAFDDALHAGFIAWRDDLAWQESDEYITEHIDANGYLFFDDGQVYLG